MKVALVHNFHAGSTPSGENEVVNAEARALERMGVEVRVAGVSNDDLALRPAHPLRAAATVGTGFGISPLRLLDGFRPDVIHVHNLFPYLGYRWLSDAESPIVATAHSYRPLCANGYLFREGNVCTLCPDGKPWSGVRYGCYRGSRLATVPLSWAGRHGAQRDPLVAAARKVLVLSDRARSIFLAAGVPEYKLWLDWHFLPDAEDPGEGTGGREGWLFVGRLTEEKGIQRLVSEWPANLHLRIVGDGPLRSALEQAAVGKRVDFLGRRERAEVVSEMRRSFGVVLPSLWYETHSLVYMEALAAGVPTLAFRPNVVAEAVERDGTGAIAEWGSVPQALAAAGNSFDDLRDRCRRLFVERYSEASFVLRRTRLYRELIG